MAAVSTAKDSPPGTAEGPQTEVWLRVCCLGRSGLMIQAIGYDKKPITVMNATISHTTRTRVTSISKYSENPRQTPAILRPARGRINLLRARHDPMRTPQ